MSSVTQADRDLVQAAIEARRHAYAPYSEFPVGAALRTSTGEIWTGVNVENASLGLSVCAERNAMFAAVGRGHRDFEAIAVVGGDGDPTPPCGACRQVLVEFAPKIRVLLANPQATIEVCTLDQLLAHPFVDFRTGGS